MRRTNATDHALPEHRVHDHHHDDAGGGRLTGIASVTGAVRWGLDRMLSIGYGVVYDYIFERFEPYCELQREVLELVCAAAGDPAHRRSVHVADIACGPGNFTVLLAEAGFSVVGVDPYDGLVELAREKRRAKHLSNLAFRHGDLGGGNTFRDATFEQIVNVHSLYVHPAPQQLLREAYRILKPGGHAIFVNHTRQAAPWSTFREVRHRNGVAAALAALLWLLPNTIFEMARKRVGPHYWGEEEFSANLRAAGFTVLEMRRTFLNGASVLVWARKDSEE
ncbi:MAG TPA: class I SAM-dependent methyltransferase [Methylomirabilota bacterium]|jgi:ubiquinone/menaquinone biosynthesis C-methylase UbiE